MYSSPSKVTNRPSRWPLGDEVGGAGIPIGAERRTQIGIGRNVLERIETHQATLRTAEIVVVELACRLVGAERPD